MTERCRTMASAIARSPAVHQPNRSRTETLWSSAVAVASVYSVARSSSASDWSQFCNGRTDESAHSQHQVHFHSLGHEITLIIAKPINQWSLIDEKEETQNTFATKNQSEKSVKTDKMSNDDLCTSFRHSASACSSCYACSCDQSAVL